MAPTADPHTHHEATHVAVRVHDFDDLLHRATAAEERLSAVRIAANACSFQHCTCCDRVRLALTREMP